MNNISKKEKKFLSKVEEEMNIFNNFQIIMEKSLKDGYISQIYKTISEIFTKELKYAVNELSYIKIKQETENIKSLLKTNLFIFKENFKLIISQSVEEYFNLLIENEEMDLYFKNDFFKKFETIEEIDESLRLEMLK